MARSKAFLFDEDERLGSRLCVAMGHPARFRMMGRLVRSRVLSYPALIEGIPLSESTISFHLSLMEREGFIRPGTLGDGTTGYQLDRSLYLACTAASRRGLRGSMTVLPLRDDVDNVNEVG